jgi:hypothetical protein
VATTPVLQSSNNAESALDAKGRAKELCTLCVDALVTEMQMRFNNDALKFLEGFGALEPFVQEMDIMVENPDFLISDGLKALVNFYELCDIEEYIAEAKIAKRVALKRLEKMDNKQTIETMLAMMSDFHEVFPNVLKLYKLALTIGCSSASCERSFSALKRVKSYLRSTMSEERLMGLSLMSIESDLAIDCDVVVTKFASICDKKRRIILK